MFTQDEPEVSVWTCTYVGTSKTSHGNVNLSTMDIIKNILGLSSKSILDAFDINMSSNQLEQYCYT